MYNLLLNTLQGIPQMWYGMLCCKIRISLSQRTCDTMRSLWHQNDVVTSFWHHNDVIITSCVCWVCNCSVNQFIGSQCDSYAWRMALRWLCLLSLTDHKAWAPISLDTHQTAHDQTRCQNQKITAASNLITSTISILMRICWTLQGFTLSKQMGCTQQHVVPVNEISCFDFCGWNRFVEIESHLCIIQHSCFGSVGFKAQDIFSWFKRCGCTPIRHLIMPKQKGKANLNKNTTYTAR